MEKKKKKLPAILLNQRGVSLVEVITVVIIIAIAGAIAAPEVIQWAENKRVTSAARDLLADLNNARLAAVEKNAHVIVSLDTANETYTIFVDNGEGAGGVAGNDTQDGDEPLLTNPPRDFSDDKYEGTNLRSTSISSPIGFTARGLPLQGNTGEIVITNNTKDKDADLWLKIVLSNSGSISLLKSKDGTNGSSWE